MGVIPTAEALALAQEKGLDLVEVAPTAVPPVCRILDYGQYKYELQKREREQKKKPAPARQEEVVEEAPAQSVQGEKIKAELDELLDEIDEVLEENAASKGRKKRAAEALSYNGLVQSFPELERLAKEPGRAPVQPSVLVEGGE